MVTPPDAVAVATAPAPSYTIGGMLVFVSAKFAEGAPALAVIV
ncbi:MAG TPA: hypothetical protein VIX84_07525 [Acidimicrobiales bacterium]